MPTTLDSLYGLGARPTVEGITSVDNITAFYGFSSTSIRGGGLAKIMRDAWHGQSSFLVTANM